MPPPTILIVDDNVLNVHVLLESLTRTGYNPLIATRGEEALQQLETPRPDLILLDIEMPGIDGFETCRRIKQNPLTEDIPIIFITAFVLEADKMKGFEVGAVDYITKPFQMKEVLARIETHLTLRQIQKELREKNTQLVQEIAERETIEEQLRQSSEKYMMLFEKMLNGFALHEIICDDKGKPIDYRFLDVNPEFERLTRLKRNDIVGKTVLEVLPGTEPSWIERYGQVALTGNPAYFENFSQEFDTYYEVTAFSPRIGRFACIFVDITERRRAENELQQYREQLEELVKERTSELEQEVAERKRTEEELQKAKDAAEEALQIAERANLAKSEFLANMSHELRTPLNAILGYAQILKNADSLAERQREGLATIQSSGEHLLTLINEILDISKIEAEHLEIQVQDVLLPDLLRRVIEMVQVRTEQKGLSFVYEFDQNLPQAVSTDEKCLRQVMLNLLDNAVKFTERGTIALRVTCGKPQPHPFTATQLRFEIEDTGSGIALEKLEEIFLPFHQIGDYLSSVDGIGLGLAISNKLVEMLGGKLRVQSTVGTGSLFYFKLNLPIVETTCEGEGKKDRRIIGYNGKRRRILIVDDKAHNRAILVGMLLPLGFEIIEAEDGRDGVEKASQYKPDLVLLDLRMPGIDGFEVCREIRDREEPQTTVVIAVSAAVFEKTRKRALANGFNDFLIKPIQQEELLNLLKTHLHINWSYEELLHKRQIFPQQKESAQVALPRQDVTMILEFASLGMVKELLSVLEELEQKISESGPFIRQLRLLAKQYQFDRIKVLVENQGEEHE